MKGLSTKYESKLKAETSAKSEWKKLVGDSEVRIAELEKKLKVDFVYNILCAHCLMLLLLHLSASIIWKTGKLECISTCQ